MLKILSIVIFIYFSRRLISGDFGIVIYHNQSDTCLNHINISDTTYEKIRPSKEILNDLNRYFSNQPTKINVLMTSFSNGHVTFCNSAARKDIMDGFIDILKMDKVYDESTLFDLIYIWGTSSFLNSIESELNKKYPNNINKRFLKSKKLLISKLK